MRYAQLVMGPAGSGKSTYCSNMANYCEAIGRVVRIINLDPAAEHFNYPVFADIRELIHIDDAMQDNDLRFGPNGGLIFCLEYLMENIDWLEEQMEDVDNDYFIFDLPGQIELYTHIPMMQKFVEKLKFWNIRVCGVFLLDSQFMLEASKYISGILTALSAMMSLEIPHINIMSKLDLLSKRNKKKIDKYLEPTVSDLLEEEFDDTKFGHRYKALNEAMASMVDDCTMVSFYPLDPSEEEHFNDILAVTDRCIQYGEDLEPKEYKEPEEPDEDDPYMDNQWD